MEENQYLDLEGLKYYHRKFKEQIPSKTSQLENDSHFMSEEDLLRMLGIIPSIDEAGLSVFFTGKTELEDYDPNNPRV